MAKKRKIRLSGKCKTDNYKEMQTKHNGKIKEAKLMKSKMKKK